jgi:hypothetical protein
MRTHDTLVALIFLIRCVTFFTLWAGVAWADDPRLPAKIDRIVAGEIPATFDLRPLDVRISPGIITAGDQLSSMDYQVQNYSTTSWSGPVDVKIYIFEQGKSVTSGTLIQTHSFAGHFSAKSSQRVTVQSPPTVPPNTPKGDYKIGVFLDILDADTGNNANAFAGARHIWVDSEAAAPAIRIATPTSDLTFSTRHTTVDISGTASDNVGVTEVTWVNSTTRTGGVASGTTSWAANGISLKNGSNVISLTARDAAGNKGTATLTVTCAPADTDPPDTIITAGPADLITSDSATFSFTGSDNETQISQLLYSTYLQGYDIGWSDFSSSTSITYSNLPDGAYTFQVQAKDQVGNIDLSPARRSFTVTAAPCSYSVSSTGNTFGPAGGLGAVGVTASFGCSWTASTDDQSRDWISIGPASMGNGYGEVSYVVSANSTRHTRTGTLTIAGQAFTVIQLGSETPCTFTLSVNVNPPGSGTVTKKPEKDAYCPGDRVTLTAHSNSGYPFHSWRGVDSSNGATAHVTMNGSRASTALFTANEEIKLPFTWTDEGTRYPVNHLGHSSQSIHSPLRIGAYHPLSFSFENSGDVEIEVTGPSRMCIGLYSGSNGSLLSYSNGLGDPKTLMKYPVSGGAAYHLVITPCISNVQRWSFSMNGPASSGEIIHLNDDLRGSIEGTISSLYDRRFYSVTAPPNAGRRLVLTLLPRQNFNGLLRLFDDKGDTLVPSANNPNDGAMDVLTFGGATPGQVYHVCLEGYTEGQHQGTGEYELRVEFVK